LLPLLFVNISVYLLYKTSNWFKIEIKSIKYLNILNIHLKDNKNAYTEKKYY